MHTENIYEAINILGENTTFMGVRLFNKDGSWKYEFDIVNMRKELKLDRHLRATNEDAMKYLFSHIEEVPEPLKKLKEEREFIQGKMDRFGKVMTALNLKEKNLKKSKYSKTFLLNFAKDFFPELKIAKNTKVPNIIKRIING